MNEQDKRSLLIDNLVELEENTVLALVTEWLEGSVPPGQNNLELTLNMIVYGLKHAFLEDISEATSADFAARWNGEVTSQAIHHH